MVSNRIYRLAQVTAMCHKVANMFGYDLDALVEYHAAQYPAATKVMLQTWIKREIEAGKDPWLSPQPNPVMPDLKLIEDIMKRDKRRRW